MVYIWIIFALIIVAVGVIILKVIYKQRKKEIEEVPAYEKKPFLTNEEKTFFFELFTKLTGYHVFTQVSLSQAIKVKNGYLEMSWFNRIRGMSLDYVICKIDTLEILLAIELDGKSHLQEKRINADERKNAALKSAKIPLLRFTNQEIRSKEGLKRAIELIKNELEN